MLAPTIERGLRERVLPQLEVLSKKAAKSGGRGAMQQVRVACACLCGMSVLFACVCVYMHVQCVCGGEVGGGYLHRARRCYAQHALNQRAHTCIHTRHTHNAINRLM